MSSVIAKSVIAKSALEKNDDWRLQGQEWLREVLLRFEPYRPPKPGFEHDHCEFCWTPFRSIAGPETAQEGYVTDDRRWICETCYEDFKVLFEWHLTN